MLESNDDKWYLTRDRSRDYEPQIQREEAIGYQKPIPSEVMSMDLSWDESKRRNTMQLDKVMASIDQFEEEEHLRLEGEERRLEQELEGARAQSGFFSNLFG